MTVLWTNVIYKQLDGIGRNDKGVRRATGQRARWREDVPNEPTNERDERRRWRRRSGEEEKKEEKLNQTQPMWCMLKNHTNKWRHILRLRTRYILWALAKHFDAVEQWQTERVKKISK